MTPQSSIVTAVLTNLSSIVLIPLFCFVAIYMLDADTVSAEDIWFFLPLNVLFLAAPKALWWLVARLASASSTSRFGSMLSADTLAVSLTLLFISLPHVQPEGWLWYAYGVFPVMAAGGTIGAAVARMGTGLSMDLVARRRRLRLAVAAAFAGCALMTVGVGSLLSERRTWSKITFPMDLRAGMTASSSFVVPEATSYRLELVVDRRLPLDSLGCLLGYPETLSNPCPDGSSTLNLSWQVRDGGVVVASGPDDLVSTPGSTTTDTLSRRLGSFQLAGGRSYELQVSSHHDASILNMTNPRIVAKAAMWVVSGPAVFWSVAVLCGLALSVVGLAGMSIVRTGCKQ